MAGVIILLIVAACAFTVMDLAHKFEGIGAWLFALIVIVLTLGCMIAW